MSVSTESPFCQTFVEKIIDHVEMFIGEQAEAELFADQVAAIDQDQPGEAYLLQVFEKAALFVQQQFAGLKDRPGDGDYDKLEKQLQKYEKDVRMHISLEQQLKLYLDSLQAKIDEQEKELLQNKEEHDKQISQQNEQIRELIKQNAQLQQQQSLRATPVEGRRALTNRTPNSPKKNPLLNKMKFKMYNSKVNLNIPPNAKTLDPKPNLFTLPLQDNETVKTNKKASLIKVNTVQKQKTVSAAKIGQKHNYRHKRSISLANQQSNQSKNLPQIQYVIQKNPPQQNLKI